MLVFNIEVYVYTHYLIVDKYITMKVGKKVIQILIVDCVTITMPQNSHTLVS